MTSPYQQGDGDYSRNATVTLDANISPYSQQVQQATHDTNSLADAIDKIDQKLGSLSQKVGHKLIQFSVGDFTALSGGVATAATLDKQLSVLNATAAITPLNMRGVKASIEQTFVSTPTSRTQIIALTQAISQLGVTGAKDLGSLVSTVLKLSEATGEGPTELAQGLVQLSRLMGTTNAHQIGNFANSLLTVSKTSGVSATGVLSFANAIAPLARQAGLGEAAVLGIAAAFTKAGADGYYAANTFNSIIGDITQLTQTGSPELTKYASFLGKTVDEFKKMPAKDQITGLFDAIAKGGPQAINFVNQLGLGTRAISSVQAVAKSGGLNQAIAQATASSGNQDNLNKAAGAATNNLADSLAKLRNILTQIGTELGETFAKPAQIAVNVLDDIAKGLNLVLKPLAPVIAGLAAITGGIAAVAGAAAGLGHIVLLAGAANLLIRGGPGQALSAGYRTERGVGTARDATYAARAAEGSLPRRASVPFAVGSFVGRQRGVLTAEEIAAREAAAGGPGVVSQVVRAGARAPMIVTGLTRQQERLVGDMGVQPLARQSYQTPVRGPMTAGQASQVAAEKEAAARVADSEAAAAETAARKQATGGLMNWVKSQVAANKASVENEGTVKAFSRTIVDATKAVISYNRQLAVTGGRLAMGGAGGKIATAEEGAATGGMMAGLKGGLGKVGGALFSPWGIAATLAAPFVIPKVSKLLKGPSQDNPDMGSYLNPIQQLNNQLGLTTSKLVDFSTGLAQANSNLPTAAANQATFQQATHVGAADVAKYQNAKVTSGTPIQGLQSGRSITGNVFGAKVVTTQSPSEQSASIQALAASMQFSSPTQIAAFKDQLIAAGYSKDVINQGLSGLVVSGRVRPASTKDIGALGQNVANQIDLKHKPPKELKALLGAGVTAIGANADQNLTTHSAAYSQAAQLQQLQALLGPILTENKTGAPGQTSASSEEIAATLSTVLGGKTSDYASYNKHGSGSYQLRSQNLMDLIAKSPNGPAILKSLGLSNASTPAQLSQVLTNTASQPSSALPAAFTGTALGQTLAGNQTFQSVAFGDQSANPAANQQAAEQATQSALQLSGSYSSASANLMKLADATGGSAQTVLQAAAQWARTLQSFQTQTKSRVGQLGTARDNLTQSAAAAQAPNASAGTIQTYQGDVQAFAQQEESYRQYMISVYQQAQQFGTQMKRSQQDENTSLYRNKRDFYIQMQQAAEDYHKQTYRAERDHNVQMSQQAMQTSQTIYNPYARTQAVNTTDAGTLIDNLGDENTRLKLQKSELDALSHMGLSTSAIQMLNLASPDQQQELDTLYQQIKQDPSIISKLNAATGKRLSLTKALTQNDFNLTFAQSNQNFQTSLKDAAQDYNTQMQRAKDAETRGLNDMADDYSRMVNRAKEDLATSMTEIYGDFGTVYGKTLSEINGQIGKYAPAIAHTLKTQIAAAVAIVDQGLGQTQIGTIGLNAKGQAGSYDAKGGWHPYQGYLTPSEAASLRRVYNPITGLAMGGISTSARTVDISEHNKAEAVIPLDQRGAQYMAGFAEQVSMAMLRRMQGGTNPIYGAGVQNHYTYTDQSLTFTGDIHADAPDARTFLDEMRKQQQLARLSSPTSSSNGR